VSAIVAHPASGENVGVSCERRKSRVVARRRREQRRFPLRTTTTAGSKSAMREQLGNWKLACQTIGGALIPRMHSRPVEEVP
jgi:hypothetical protein